MKLEKGKIIELNDNQEYYIIDKIYLNNKCYLYLSNIDPTEDDNVHFMEYLNGSVYPLEDEKTIKELLLIIANNNA